MKKSNDGFSIVLALFLVLAMILTAQYILSYIIPFGQYTKGIENSAKAYYEATKANETAIYQIKRKSIQLQDVLMGTLSGNIANTFEIDGNSNIIPPSGKGNSELDKDFNKLSLNDPIQIILTNNALDLNAINFELRIPDFATQDPNDPAVNPKEIINLELNDKDGNPLYFHEDGSPITSMGDIPIIGWSLASNSNTLIGSRYITLGQINAGVNTTIGSLNLEGKNLEEETKDLNLFYRDVTSAGIGVCGIDEEDKCILKFTLINKLKLKADEDPAYPYLEYKLDLGGAPSSQVLTKNARIRAEGKSYGFKRYIDIDVPQKSSNAAFDFTIMQ